MGTLATNTPAELVRDYMLAGGRAPLFTGWAIKIGKMPPEPDECICFLDQPDTPAFPHLLLDILGLQIIVRGSRAGDGYRTGRLMINTIRDILLGVDGHPPEFSELDGITERTGIVSLGDDDQDRRIWSYNMRLYVEPETNALTHRESL